MQLLLYMITQYLLFHPAREMYTNYSLVVTLRFTVISGP